MQNQSDKNKKNIEHNGAEQQKWIAIGRYEINYLLVLVVVGCSIPTVILQNWLLLLPALAALIFGVRRRKNDGV